MSERRSFFDTRANARAVAAVKAFEAQMARAEDHVDELSDEVA